MSKALIIVDYTNDFVAEDGKLSVGKPARDIAAVIRYLIIKSVGEDTHIFVCNDLHEHNEPYSFESKLFVPHNLKGTTGAQLYPDIKEAIAYVRNAGSERINRLSKTRYSAFAGTKLELMLKERSVNEVTIVGVCTDICVLHTAIDAFNRCYAINVPQNAVATFQPQVQAFALEHMQKVLGADISPVEVRI